MVVTRLNHAKVNSDRDKNRYGIVLHNFIAILNRFTEDMKLRFHFYSKSSAFRSNIVTKSIMYHDAFFLFKSRGKKFRIIYCITVAQTENALSTFKSIHFGFTSFMRRTS